jgi:hypothetical protein
LFVFLLVFVAVPLALIFLPLLLFLLLIAKYIDEINCGFKPFIQKFRKHYQNASGSCFTENQIDKIERFAYHLS